MTNPQTEARAIVDALPGPDDWTDEEYNAAVESIATALAAKDAELVKANMLACANAQDAADESERAERQWAGWVKEEALRKAAEASLAKANKALEEIEDAKTELTNRHDYSRGWNDALFRVRQIARRAREAALRGDAS